MGKFFEKKRRTNVPNGKNGRSSLNDTERAQERANTIAIIVDFLSEQGIDVADWLLQRLDRLAKLSPTTADEASSIVAAGVIFKYVREHAPERAYSRMERLLAKVGTLLSDVGKTGPLKATPEVQGLIIRMFAVENVPDRENLLLRDFLATYLRKPWIPKLTYRVLPFLWQRHLLRSLRRVGINPDTTTLKTLHDMHTVWTLDLLQAEGSGIPSYAIPAAACHHRLRGDNPRDIIAEDDTYNTDFGLNKAYDRPEKLVTALDLYDAFRRRSEMTHQEAVDAVWEAILSGRDGYYANDPEFAEIMNDIEIVLADKEQGET